MKWTRLKAGQKVKYDMTAERNRGVIEPEEYLKIFTIDHIKDGLYGMEKAVIWLKEKGGYYYPARFVVVEDKSKRKLPEWF